MTFSCALALVLACSSGDCSGDASQTPRFGSGLVLLEDQDGDGQSELLIVDSMGRDRGSSARMYVYSPGAGRCLRVIEPMVQPSPGEQAITRVHGSAKGDVVYIGHEFTGSSDRAYLMSLCTRTGAQSMLMELERYVSTWWGPVVSNIGNLDEAPGDELLVNYASKLEGDDSAWVRRGFVVSIVSRKTLRVINELWPVVVGDLDGDSVSDYVHSNAGVYSFRSTKSGELLFDISPTTDGHPGESTVGFFPAGDVNGDGKGDLVQVVTGPAETGDYSDASVLSGKNGQLLWGTERVLCTGVLRCQVLSIRDQDGDKVPDLVVANTSEVTGFGDCPGWDVYSGATGKLIAHHAWPERSGGTSVAMHAFAVSEIDDCNADGLSDLAFSDVASIFRMYKADGAVALNSARSGPLRRLRSRDMQLQAK